jgi:hypothetical protein
VAPLDDLSRPREHPSARCSRLRTVTPTSCFPRPYRSRPALNIRSTSDGCNTIRRSPPPSKRCSSSASRTASPSRCRKAFKAPVGGITLPDLIAIGVEREANEADNRAKLAAPTQARRRHLFVIFNGSSGSFFNAVDRAMESRLPKLPDPITTAWAACRGHVLVTTPPGPWELYEVPEDVFFTPERWLA